MDINSNQFNKLLNTFVSFYVILIAFDSIWQSVPWRWISLQYRFHFICVTDVWIQYIYHLLAWSGMDYFIPFSGFTSKQKRSDRKREKNETVVNCHVYYSHVAEQTMRKLNHTLANRRKMKLQTSTFKYRFAFTFFPMWNVLKENSLSTLKFDFYFTAVRINVWPHLLCSP